MKTSKEWWDKTKKSNETIINWLKNQYHGEKLASSRIEKYILPLIDDKYKFMVERIASDEEKHSNWISDLLKSRGVLAEILNKEERYWNEVMTDDFKNDSLYAAGVAARAEEMRLERIKVIMNDNECDTDIRDVFTNIYKDELFHAKGFKLVAGDEYYNKTSEKHARGLEKLGLII